MEIFRTIVGPPAEGNVYFHREYLDERLWREIRKGEQLLVSAPRRIGKTSFLKHVCKQENKGYFVKYFIIESADSSNDFFKQLYTELLEHLSSKQRIWESLSDFRKSRQIEKIGPDGIELKAIDLDYFEEFKCLIKKVEIEEKLVFIIDEFSEVVENIINVRGEDHARKFLHQNRELRHKEEIITRVCFIYSGSIGLGNLAESINATKIINDLTEFQIPPLMQEEAFSMIDQLSINPELAFANNVQQYLIDKINWLIPYYIQVILSELETLMIYSGKLPDHETVDKAIDEALKKRTYFEHWLVRLTKVYKEKDYDFAIQVLNNAAETEYGVSKNQIFDIGVNLGIKNESFRRILRMLEYDGYFNRNEKQIYSFSSPILRTWWERNVL